ncbi:GyrI-like domain-containing protein [Saccharibacillus brassicae]|uniref:AraC family transcriptional regulator n=1 Tax=Saccharibacillus brassicae TaxID=2583377 RepID=A0A4Y6UX38_SACBS|nr:effector binding domain-containing protein [Saccharibacillus brassicae]QDH21088.1 AraC family transcriptional regulator [Saccharibacillus brassicae]
MESFNASARQREHQEESESGAAYETRKAFALTGFAARTTNAAEFGSAGKIPGLWQTYGQSSLAADPGPEVLNPHLLYALYTDYESDASGAYTLVIGHESAAASAGSQTSAVRSEASQAAAESAESGAFRVPETFRALVPQSRYRVFKTRTGPMGEVVAEAWAGIWAHFEQSAERRTYTGDFELYDTRGMDPEAAEVLIYIAVG